MVVVVMIVMLARPFSFLHLAAQLILSGKTSLLPWRGFLIRERAALRRKSVNSCNPAE